MAWSRDPVSPRAARLPADWYQRRMKVLARDAHRCVAQDSQGYRCAERATDVDHIVRGDDHDLGNLQALCGWHHRQKTAVEAAEARRAKPRRSRFHEGEPHPGLLPPRRPLRDMGPPPF